MNTPLRICADTLVLTGLSLLILVAVVDAGGWLVIDKKLEATARSVAGLIPREGVVSRTAFAQSAAAGRSMMPYREAAFGLDLSAVSFPGPGAAPVVSWQESYNMRPFPAALNVAAGQAGAGQRVLVVTASYEYAPLVLRLVNQSIRLHHSVVRPAPDRPVTRTYAGAGRLKSRGGG